MLIQLKLVLEMCFFRQQHHTFDELRCGMHIFGILYTHVSLFAVDEIRKKSTRWMRRKGQNSLYYFWCYLKHHTFLLVDPTAIAYLLPQLYDNIVRFLHIHIHMKFNSFYSLCCSFCEFICVIREKRRDAMISFVFNHFASTCQIRLIHIQYKMLNVR